MRSIQKSLWLIAIAAGAAQAQVPPEIAKQLVAIGRGVCVPATAQIYRPLHPNPPHSGISITRDVSFGPDPKNVLDVFTPEKADGARPVLIYAPGGAGNKQQGGPNGDVFYDNIGVWAVKNGMVEVNMQRRAGQTWDDPAKDVSLIVQWVHKNIAGYKGNPARVFIWAQSAGNVPVGTYIGHPEFYGAEGVGIKGAILMSGPGFDILPAIPPPAPGGSPCGQPAGTAPAAARPAAAQADDPIQLARSNLPGLINAKLPLLITSAELDPPSYMAFAQTLKDEICKAGKSCPTYLVFKDHSHISQVLSPGTADTSVTGPILNWMKSVK
ncbi:MAG: carboxylesterase family protein [Bryobacteraceae bacterium]